MEARLETVDEYKFDPKADFSELIIPTKDSVCYTHLLDILLLNKKHVLMTGPTGTGKSVNILRYLQHGISDKYVPLLCHSPLKLAPTRRKISSTPNAKKEGKACLVHLLSNSSYSSMMSICYERNFAPSLLWKSCASGSITVDGTTEKLWKCVPL